MTSESAPKRISYRGQTVYLPSGRVTIRRVTVTYTAGVQTAAHCTIDGRRTAVVNTRPGVWRVQEEQTNGND